MPHFFVQLGIGERLCNSSMSSTDTAEKLLTKLRGFLISCAMPAVSWPRSKLFRLDQAVLRSLRTFPVTSPVARASLHPLEKTRILIANTDCAANV